MLIVRSHEYKILAQFVPISVETNNAETIAWIEADSGLNRGVIQWMMWAKPPAKHHTNQRVAHLIVYFDSAKVANHAIRNGLYIGGKSCPVRKVLRKAQCCANVSVMAMITMLALHILPRTASGCMTFVEDAGAIIDSLSVQQISLLAASASIVIPRVI
jgi:hypothetical protein